MDIKRQIKEGIHIRRQRSTLNRDDGYKLPAIFNHLLSRDYSTAKNNARDMHVQELAQEVDAKKLMRRKNMQGTCPIFAVYPREL